MKKLLCNDRQTNIKLESQSFLLSLEPYIDETTIQLQLSNQKGIAYYTTNHAPFPECCCFNSWDEVPSGTFFILTHQEEIYTTFFCLSHRDHLVSLKGEKNHLLLKGQSGSSREANSVRPALLSLKGDDAHSTIRKTILQALTITGGLGKPARDKNLPTWLDRLGLFVDGNLDHASILAEVKNILDTDYPINHLLIGEGWQDTKKQTLASFAADPIRFPNQLKVLIDELKELGIIHVGVYHSMMGAAGGVHSQLAKRYDLPPDSEGRYFLGYDLGRTFQFYHDYYSHLREQGITFIKVGNQNSLFQFCRSGMDITRLYQNLQTALQAAGNVHFSCSPFNGDCLFDANLFYWGSSDLAEMGNTLSNILQNILWAQYLIQPDLGCWKETEQETILHALTGSLHLIKKTSSLLKKAMLPSGKILQPDKPLTLCADSLFITEKAPYKAFTTKGEWGIIAAFNLNQKNVQGEIGPSDIPGLIEDQYALLSQKQGFMGVLNHNEKIPFKLESEQTDIFTFAPLHRGVAVLGCPYFFLAPGPLTEIDIEDENIHISSNIGTSILIYCEKDVLEVRRNGVTIPWEYDHEQCTLSIDFKDQIFEGHANYTIIFS